MIFFIGYCIIVFLLICAVVVMDGYNVGDEVNTDPAIPPILIFGAMIWPITIVVMIVFGFFTGLHQMAQTRAEQQRAARSTNSNRS